MTIRTPRSYEAVATHPVIADRVYAGNWSGLVMSVDGGETWEQPETGPSGHARGLLRVRSFEPGHHVCRRMARASFEATTMVIPGHQASTTESIWSIAVDHSNPNTVYVCTYNGVFKSVDGGVTWNPASEGLTAQYCWGLAIDPHDPSTIYQASGEGVFRSTNGGAEWSPFSGLEEYSVYDLQFSPDGGTLFAATGGGGVGAYTFSGSGCSIDCSAIVPETAFAGSATYFQAEATTIGCSSPPSYEWDFGDGSQPSDEQQSDHIYDEAGTYTWSMTARADGASCAATGDILVWTAPSHWYVPGIAHAPGGGGEPSGARILRRSIPAPIRSHWT